ncbi:MAG: thioredoxin family protein [Anaerolineales bacterium]|nr:thioredoxin family protein [Anaerolineales bacterium]
MLEIKILGPGCANCVKVDEIAHSAVINLGVEAQIIKVTDSSAIRSYQLLATPGLVVNEKVVCAGRIPSEGEVMNWLASASESA